MKKQAHCLHPVVIIGANGLSEAVLNEIDVSLTAHELIKVKINGQEKASRQQLGEEIANVLNATYIQLIGHVVTLYRKNPDKS